MARALIVGCGCRGRELGGLLAGRGWAVRGTTREAAHGDRIAAAGIEAAIADPDRPGTILELVGDVTVVVWLLGSARGAPELLAAIHGPRLERLLEKLVDTPVRGFAYQAAGGVGERDLERGAEIVRAASQRWRIPVALLDEGPCGEGWSGRAAKAVVRLVEGEGVPPPSTGK